ncbi:UvrD-helicase domain-containing protein [Plesiomonas shigelloides]|uniref:UvrD-helicase domain-containing protein n=1 Tax=Plesiomonas shigelloides TaxID=703 RepID=UPI00387F0B69
MTSNEHAEQQVQDNIIENVNNFTSFIFNAGAGAGKTFALIETLKYVTLNKIHRRKTAQKIACITYTNVAANEIKNRLGNSDVVYVSTIHEILWSIIKNSQRELLICHAKKIQITINKIENDLLKGKDSDIFYNLSEQQQIKFVDFLETTKDTFYQSINKSAKKAKEDYEEVLSQHDEFIRKLFNNIKKFRSVAKLIYNKNRLQLCLQKINSGEERYVHYDSKVNADRLHYMRFSHDTLIDYSLSLIEDHPTLCRIIIDCYPYIFIDEYQDTHENVIKIMAAIHEYSNKNNKRWMIGYFGDTAQNIYSDGVGNKLLDIHKGLSSIKKEFNRRSHQQIIDVANKIRNDEIKQKPIDINRRNGSVNFYHKITDDEENTVKKFLCEFKKSLIHDKDTKEIHCLVLTNKLMTIFNGFSDVYVAFSKSTIFIDNLNTQVLSQQLEKLHPTVAEIYHLVKLYKDIQDNEVSYYEIFGEFSNSITFSKASLTIRTLQQFNAVSLKDLINSINNALCDANINSTLSKALINRLSYHTTNYSLQAQFKYEFLESIRHLMCNNSADEDTINEKTNLILELPINSLIRWVEFINRLTTNDINYHTYHGTKGEEYLNVAIILSHDFGSKKDGKDKFKNYFKLVEEISNDKNHSFPTSQLEDEYTNTKNLIYVACTRSIKNLRILYLDDISDIQEGIKKIFTETIPWNKQ